VDSLTGCTMDSGMASKSQSLADNHTEYGSMLGPQSSYRISGRAFDASNVALALVTHGDAVLNNYDRNMENNSVNRNTANNFANLNTENSFNSNPTAESNNFISQSTVSLSQNPIYSHADMTASDMYSNHVPGPSGFPVPVGPGPVTTWSVDTHPVHREVTSSYPPLGIFGPNSSQPGNPFIDVYSRYGLPPSMYYNI